MGINTSIPAEEIISVTTLDPPQTILPLDITSLVPTFPQGVPPSLTRFRTYSDKLWQFLTLLPSKDADIPDDWFEVSSKWCRVVVLVLKEMHEIAQELERKRPLDLRGSYHAVEEYRCDIATTLREFQRVVEIMGGAEKEDLEKVKEAIEAIREIRVLRAYLEGSV